MRILDSIPFEIDPEAAFARLHLDPQGKYASEVNALIDSARRIARPRALYKAAFVQDREPDAVVIGEAPCGLHPSPEKSNDARPFAPDRLCSSAEAGATPSARTRFVSRALRGNLDEVERVFPYVATCGRELDSISIAPDDIFGQFCLDTIKEMALWAAVSHLYEHLTETHEISTLTTMNPGSGEVNVWPIEQQKDLFAFLGDVQESIGVVLTDSCLMVPNKSVSGIFYPSEDGFQNCQLCRREQCTERRAPFDPHLWARIFDEAG